MSSRPYYFMSMLVGLAVTGQIHAGHIRGLESVSAMNRITATVPFDLYQGYFMVAHGSVGTLKNLNFFLDTGTSLSVVDSRTAKKLNLRSEQPASIVVVGGRAQGEDVSLPSIQLGPVRRSDLQVVTTDLSFFDKALPVHIDAIVGLDVLGQRPFVIDYSARVIRFGTVPAMPVSIPLHLEAGLAVFDAEIDHEPVHLLFDTGASSLILFGKTATVSSSGNAGADAHPEAIGDFESKEVLLRSLKLGDEEFRKKPARVTRNPKPSQLDFDGLMSPVALGISQVSVDVKGGVLAFSR